MVNRTCTEIKSAWRYFFKIYYSDYQGLRKKVVTYLSQFCGLFINISFLSKANFYLVQIVHFQTSHNMLFVKAKLCQIKVSHQRGI